MLAERVASGELPSVAERLPENPAVYPVLEMTGKYGGTLRRGFKGVSDRTGPSKVRDCSLVHFNSDLSIRPDVVESWTVSADGTEFTMLFRPGMKWSDGHPFGVDDVMWYYEHQLKHPELTSGPPERYSVGSPRTMAEMTKVDDRTLRVKFAAPFPLFMHGLNRTQPFVPGHYMQQFHLDLVDDKEALQAKVKEAGLNSWTELYLYHASWFNDVLRPDVTPWISVNELSNELFIMERNPYFHAVDPDGQQLPYVDTVTHRLFESIDVFNMWIVNGEIDWQNRHVDLANYTLFSNSADNGDYQVLMWPTDYGDTLSPNHTSKNPKVREFWSSKEVRAAMSVAIDRETMNELVYFGLGVPRQSSPTGLSPYYVEDWANNNAHYDPEQANALLDQAGYTERNAEGFRLWRDGSGEPVFLTIETIQPQGSPSADCLDLVVNDWKAVGINCTWASRERSLFEVRRANSEEDAEFFQIGHETMVFLLGSNNQFDGGIWCPAWDNYRNLGPDDPISERPPDGHWIWDLWDLYASAHAAPDEETRLSIHEKVAAIHIEQTPVIGTIGEMPGPIIVKNGLRNIAGSFLLGNYAADESLLGSATYFWEEPNKHA